MKNKKLCIILLAILVFNFFILNNMNIKLFLVGDITTAMCHEPGVIKAFRILSKVINIIKILVPVILILTGIHSAYKLVITEQDGGGKKIARLIIEKFLVGSFIFFIPSIVYAIMSYASGYDETSSKFTDCGQCLTNTDKCDTLLSRYDK